MSTVQIKAPDLVRFEITAFGKTRFRRTDRVKIATYVAGKLNSERWYRQHDVCHLEVTFDGELV